MKITFVGGARSVTGSLLLCEHENRKFILECGLFQGHRDDADRINRTFPFKPKDIQAAVLTHGHLDHSGNLPSLCKRGYAGPVFCTAATRDIASRLLLDAAHIQQNDIAFINKKAARPGLPGKEPLYTVPDVERTIRQFSPIGYGMAFEPVPGVRATLADAGHILGSALVLLEAGGVRTIFSGDLGRRNMPIVRDPVVIPDVDNLILESTYGGRTHTPIDGMAGELAALIKEAKQRRGKIIIPAFAVERTQILVKILKDLHRDGLLKSIPVYVDSPLATDITEVYRTHPECFDAATYELFIKDDPFRFPGLNYVRDSNESRKLNDSKETIIVIAGSGMCEGGRVLHHLIHSIQDPDNMIIFVGFQAQATLGRRIVEGISPVSIFGDRYEVRARVHFLGGFSAHADGTELLDYVKGMTGARLKRVFLVHGEPEQALALAEQISSWNGRIKVEIPQALTEAILA